MDRSPEYHKKLFLRAVEEAKRMKIEKAIRAELAEIRAMENAMYEEVRRSMDEKDEYTMKWPMDVNNARHTN